VLCCAFGITLLGSPGMHLQCFPVLGLVIHRVPDLLRLFSSVLSLKLLVFCKLFWRQDLVQTSLLFIHELLELVPGLG
jgi:hypothetical protein